MKNDFYITDILIKRIFFKRPNKPLSRFGWEHLEIKQFELLIISELLAEYRTVASSSFLFVLLDPAKFFLQLS